MPARGFYLSAPRVKRGPSPLFWMDGWLDGWMDGWIRVREKVNCSQSRERDRAFDERLRCLSFSLSLSLRGEGN